ncbi:MAG: helix-turn-helix transcriptional regulator [Eubacteriales bacterium]
MKKNKSKEQLNLIGENIALARKKAKMSQQKLSELLELEPVYVCRGSISRIEHGERAITDIEIKAIAKILKCSPNDLFGWENDG